MMGRNDDGVLPLVYAIASVALRYPGSDVAGRRRELADLAAELPRAGRERLDRFFGWWCSLEPRALEQVYVETFDLHKRVSLYLTYYSYGDRRQRGQEFVRLKRLYEAAGWRLAGRELPDYLPLVLEFAAREPDPGRAILAHERVPLELLRAALEDAESPYAGVVDVVCLGLPDLDRAGRELLARLAAEGPPGEQVGLEPFGPPEAMPDALSEGLAGLSVPWSGSR